MNGLAFLLFIGLFPLSWKEMSERCGKYLEVNYLVANSKWCKCLYLDGFEAQSWFTPYAPAIETQAQWQIQGYHLDEDSANRFALDVGLGTSKPQDYSFWLDKLSWKQITSSDYQAMFGKSATMLISNNNSIDNQVLYDLVIPDTIDTKIPATKVGYGQGNPENLVESVVSLQKENTLHLIIIANKPIQWVRTSTDKDNQTVTFTWLLNK